MKPFIGQAAALALGVLACAGVSGAEAADKPYEGVTLAPARAKTIVRDPASGTPSHRASTAGKNPCP